MRLPVLWAFLRRDAKIQTAYKWGFLFNFIAILSGSASFFFVSRLIHPEAGSALASYGGSYFSFVVVGLAFARYQGIGMNGFLGGLQRERNAGRSKSCWPARSRSPSAFSDRRSGIFWRRPGKCWSTAFSALVSSESGSRGPASRGLW